MATLKRKKVILIDDTNKSNCVGLIQCIKEWKSFITPETERNVEGDLSIGVNTSNGVFEFWKPVSINIISNETLKGADWFVWKNEIHRYHSDAGYGIKTWTNYDIKDGSSVILSHSNVVGKIIASTDVSLNLAEPSKSFIDKYIKEFNRGKIITDVMVEYNSGDENMDGYVAMFGGKILGDTLKINSDGTITIRKVKDNWNRDEAIELCRKAFNREINGLHHSTIIFDNWVEENF